jgi:hypothetical protein
MNTSLKVHKISAFTYKARFLGPGFIGEGQANPFTAVPN